jgi:cytochrome d ubiquinol oxidase subunit I
MAIGAYYLLRRRTPQQIAYGRQFVKTGLIAGIVTVILMLPFAHLQAAQVAQTQPAKLAAMEAQWADGPVGFSLEGTADEKAGTSSLLELPISGLTSFLATGDFETVYPGLNTMKDGPVDLSKYEGVTVDSYPGGIPPVNVTFQAYHIMVLLFGCMVIWLILAGILLRKSKRDNKPVPKALAYLVVFGPLVPFIAIQAGWMVTEIGRQPWVVYGLLLTDDAISMSVSAVEILITILLFIVFYVTLFVAWLRIVLGQIKKGPEAALATEAAGAAEATGAALAETVPAAADVTDAAVGKSPAAPATDAPADAAAVETPEATALNDDANQKGGE